MNRHSLRAVAFVVLALLGAPVAMHVLLHDLHHHDHEDAGRVAMAGERGHGDHEHPVVSTAPAATAGTRSVTAVITLPLPAPMTLIHRAGAHRNLISPGSLRMDDDVGLQKLLSTFLI